MALVVGERLDVALDVGDAPTVCRGEALRVGLGDAVGVGDALVVCVGVCKAVPAAEGLVDGDAPNERLEEGVAAKGEGVGERVNVGEPLAVREPLVELTRAKLVVGDPLVVSERLPAMLTFTKALAIGGLLEGGELSGIGELPAVVLVLKTALRVALTGAAEMLLVGKTVALIEELPDDMIVPESVPLSVKMDDGVDEVERVARPLGTPLGVLLTLASGENVADAVGVTLAVLAVAPPDGV